MKVLIFFLVFAVSTVAGATTSGVAFCERYGFGASRGEAFDTLSEAYGQAYQLSPFRQILIQGATSEYFFATNRIDAVHLAAIRGDGDGFFALIRKSNSSQLLFRKDRYDRTLLHYAALGGNLKIVRHLFRHGASHRVFERFGMTPLHFAVAGGNTAIVDLLLKKGASLQQRDNEGASLMRQAAASGNLTMVKYLRKRGLSYLSEDYHRKNIYHYLNPEAADLWSLLVKKRVGFNRPEFVDALLNTLAESDSPALVEAVKKHTRDTLPNLYVSLLTKAVEKKKLNILRFLLAQGVSVDSATFNEFVGRLPFVRYADDNALVEDASVEDAYSKIIRHMMSAGATPDASSVTQLCQRRHFDSAVWLMNQGVIPDSSGLHCFAKTGNQAFVDNAVGMGATPDGDTLHGAAQSGNLTLLKVLHRKYNLPLHARSSNNDSTLQSAIRGNNLDMVRYLVAHGAKPSVEQNRQRQNELHTLLYICDDKMVDFFSSESDLLSREKYRNKETYRLAAYHYAEPA